MSKPTARFNVSAPKPYTDRDGNEKKQWINVGRATQWDDGNISIELHSVPVGNWFDGKLMLFPQDDNKQQAQRTERSRPQRQQSDASYGDRAQGGFEDDDIPFHPFRRKSYF